jgi:hypothetical protein
VLDAERCEALTAEHNGVYLDYSRQRVTMETMGLLYDVAEAAHLRAKIDSMFAGDHINSTEDRAVLHVASRAPRHAKIMVDGKDVVPDVHAVLDKIKEFSRKVREGEWVGATGKPLTDVVAVGIGGSFLGPLFVHTALRTNKEAAAQALPGQCGPCGRGARAERAGPGDHAGGHRVQDVHHRRDDAQRTHRAQLDHVRPGQGGCGQAHGGGVDEPEAGG